MKNQVSYIHSLVNESEMASVLPHIYKPTEMLCTLQEGIPYLVYKVIQQTARPLSRVRKDYSTL